MGNTKPHKVSNSCSLCEDTGVDSAHGGTSGLTRVCKACGGKGKELKKTASLFSKRELDEISKVFNGR